MLFLGKFALSTREKLGLDIISSLVSLLVFRISKSFLLKYTLVINCILPPFFANSIIPRAATARLVDEKNPVILLYDIEFSNIGI